MRGMNRREWSRTILGGLGAAALPAIARGATQPADRVYKYVHLDVFTTQRLAGNQLGVFLDPGSLDADTMRAMTRETNFSECTFIFPPERVGTDFRVRIFTRSGETPFAGHPTIGSAFALAEAGRIKPGTAQ